MNKETGICYQTNEDFVETKTNLISPTAVDNPSYPYFGKWLKTLRSFPVGTRNCYTLKPKQGKNRSYLITASFSYGNYDGKYQVPTFDLYFGSNHQTIYPYNYYELAEVIHTLSTDTIDVCLVKTGPTIPFISSLELKPLNNSIYQVSPTSQFLFVVGRYDVGARNNQIESRWTSNFPTYYGSK